MLKKLKSPKVMIAAIIALSFMVSGYGCVEAEAVNPKYPDHLEVVSETHTDENKITKFIDKENNKIIYLTESDYDDDMSMSVTDIEK